MDDGDLQSEFDTYGCLVDSDVRFLVFFK